MQPDRAGVWPGFCCIQKTGLETELHQRCPGADLRLGIGTKPPEARDDSRKVRLKIVKMDNYEIFTHFDTAFNQTSKTQDIKIHEKNQSLFHRNTAVTNLTLDLWCLWWTFYFSAVWVIRLMHCYTAVTKRRDVLPPMTGGHVYTHLPVLAMPLVPMLHTHTSITET